MQRSAAGDSDGRACHAVAELKELKDQDPEAVVFQRPNRETLFQVEVFCNGAQDLENWLGRKDAPEEMALDRDPNGVVRLGYDGELCGTVEEEGGGYGKYFRHGHATVRLGNGIVFEGVFEDGAPQGHGLLVFPYEDSGEGNFDCDRLQGNGTFT